MAHWLAPARHFSTSPRAPPPLPFHPSAPHKSPMPHCRSTHQGVPRWRGSHLSASPTPTSQGLPSLFFPGFPGGAAQAPAEWRRTTASTTAPPQKKVVSGAAGNENIPTTGGDGGWRHTLPAKEGNALTPPGLPIDQRRHTSAWQRWKPRRKTANICSGLVRGPALIEGKRLETRGQKFGHKIGRQPPSRTVLLRSARCKGSRTELTPVQHSTWGTPATQSPGLARQNGGLVAANLARGSALCGEAQ